LPGREIVTLLTQVEVDRSDPALAKPSKPIGPVYGGREAQQLAARAPWTFVPEGRGFRRAVPFPNPRRIREINAIKLLVHSGMIVICAGGGGIPVVATPDGGLRGIEAVIDKDLSSALMAEQIGADALLLRGASRIPLPIRSHTPAISTVDAASADGNSSLLKADSA
jgi:carbamate kinase